MSPVIKTVHIFQHTEDKKGSTLPDLLSDRIMEYLPDDPDIEVKKRLEYRLVKMVLPAVLLIAKEEIIIVHQDLPGIINKCPETHMVQIRLVILFQLLRINPEEEIIFVLKIIVKCPGAQAAVSGDKRHRNLFHRMSGKQFDC